MDHPVRILLVHLAAVVRSGRQNYPRESLLLCAAFVALPPCRSIDEDLTGYPSGVCFGLDPLPGWGGRGETIGWNKR